MPKPIHWLPCAPSLGLNRDRYSSANTSMGVGQCWLAISHMPYTYRHAVADMIGRPLWIKSAVRGLMR